MAPDCGAVRIGNCSGFYGDRLSAMREMLTGGELDYLTGDYLAELTMLILGRDRMKNPDRGYAKTFLAQLEDCLGLAHDRGVRIVTNAGGLNPAGLANAVRALAARLGIPAQVAHVEGDDLQPRAAELGLGTPLTANAYLGAWGIVDCFERGADVVVTGRVTDASVVVGAAAAHFGWGRTDYHRLAGAVVAGHVIECGVQATGGNYAFFTEIGDLTHAGFPLAEIAADGSSVITKHHGTGGLVSVDTITAQLLYEITGARYANPDVTARMDSVELSPDGPDRVRISGVIGEPPPPTYKVSLNSIGGFRNAMTFVLTGLDIDAKADLVRRQLEAALTVKPAELQWTLARTDHPDADTEETASALLTCVARDPDPANVGRQFSSAAVELALASYPGFTATAPPGDGQVYGVFTPGYVDAGKVAHIAVHADGTRTEIPCATETLELAPAHPPALPDPLPAGPTRRVPLGLIAGARSGDKGGSANVGVWDSTAGGAYVPGMSDHVVMIKERSKVFLAGPPLVKMATGEESDDESLGGAEMHARISGLADYFALDELDAIRIGRRIVARLNWIKQGPAPAPVTEPLFDAEELIGIVPPDLRIPFDPREVIARIVDGSEFDEFKPLYGSSLVTGWARLHGYPLGILANARGVLFSEESQKATQFIQLANRADTPLLFLHNTTGYMVGKDYEEGGMIKHGSMMINAVSNSTVPHISLLIGASYGAGHYGMCGRAYDPRFLFAWPSAKSAVMGGAQLSGVLSIVARAAAEARGQQVDEAADAAMRAAVEGQIEAESLPLVLSGMLYDDGVIDPRDTRTVLGMCLSAIANGPIKGTSNFGVFRM